MIDHIIVHIPATAGTSVRAAIGTKRVVHDMARHHYRREGVDWGKYFKYSIVRNTYDRTVSICAKLHGCVMGNWLTPEVFHRTMKQAVARGEDHDEVLAKLCAEHNQRHKGRWLTPEVFRKWVANGMPDTRIHNNENTARMCTPQRDYLTGYDGEWIVDHVMRFEYLDEDLPPLCALLDVPVVSNIENKNPSARDLGYQEYYNNETKNRVDDHFAVDLEEWHHQF